MFPMYHKTAWAEITFSFHYIFFQDFETSNTRSNVSSLKFEVHFIHCNSKKKVNLPSTMQSGRNINSHNWMLEMIRM